MSVERDEPLIVVDDDWDFDDPVDDEPGARRPRRRVLFGLIAVAGLLLASVIVTAFDADEGNDDRPDTADLAAVPPWELPDTLTEQWSLRLAGTGNAIATSLILGDALVVAIVDDGSRDRSLVVGVDAASGEQRWQRSFPYSPTEMTPLLIRDGSVVLEQNDRFTDNRLIALDATDGEERWERRMPGVSISGVLDGTALVANIDERDSDVRTTFYAPGTGDALGTVDGEITTTDLDGTWFLASDTSLEELDLRDGWTEPVTASALGDASRQRVAVIDDRVLTVDATGRLAEVGDDGALSLLRAEGVPRIEAMWPGGERTMVAVGDGQVVGLELLRDAVSMQWQREGRVRQFGLTDEGQVLVVAPGEPELDEGSTWVVVDGATGDDLRSFAPQVAGNSEVVIASDGFVTSPNGAEYRAFDRDGLALWRLDGAERLALGEGLVVSLANSPGGFRLTAYRG